MSSKISNRFLANYVLMFISSTLIAILAVILLSFSSDVLNKNLLKNNYTASSILKDNISEIDTTPIVERGGGVQIINQDLDIFVSSGLSTFTKDKLTTEEFTRFLINSKSVGLKYSHDIVYNSEKQFWLIVTFPTSIRINIDVAYNNEYTSSDFNNVFGVILAIIIFYLLLLAVSTIIYSKISSVSVVNPLKTLCFSAGLIRDGDYSARVNLNLKNEFGELEVIFNDMATKIEQEISLRKISEENRKRLLLDISHDLKNPLASIMGYAELCSKNHNLSKEDQNNYIETIYNNSVRADNLITNLFELSKMESSEFTLNKKTIDISEYVREEIAVAIKDLEEAGFTYEVNIPEIEIYAEIDTKQMSRVFQNLVSNAIKYNAKGTNLNISLSEDNDKVNISFLDNGIGIPKKIAKDIFLPFVRADSARSSQTGGIGLGLAIAEKIIKAHGGNISLETDINKGCSFYIQIPKNL